MAKILAKHSTTGMRTEWTKEKGRVEVEFEHIVCKPSEDKIASCTACGRDNYKGGCTDGDAPIEPNGLALFDLDFNATGQCSISIRLCPDCIKDLRSKVFGASA